MGRYSLFFKRFILALILAAGGNAWAQTGAGQGNRPLCPAGFDVPPRPILEAELEEGDIHINADYIDIAEQGVSHLKGNAELTKDTQQVRADDVFYYDAKNNADLSGDVKFWDSAIFLNSDTAHIEFDNSTGIFKNADYRLLDNRGRGFADELFIDLGEITTGTNIDYSTCEPESNGWRLENNTWKITASEMVLNHETNRGTGRDVVLKIKDIPVFYSPYFTFPLNQQRKSGFLTPAFGSSSNNGFEFRAPYYWNIAPNMDATFTPRLITDSGFMGMGEYRYLFNRGGGHLNVQYLPGDNQFGNRDRSYLDFEHEQTYLRSGRLSLKYKRVSDNRYFENFGASLATTSKPVLLRRAYASYAWRVLRGSLSLAGNVQEYQIVNANTPITARPYRILPSIRLNYVSTPANFKLNYRLSSRVDYFTRGDDPRLINVNGLRFDLLPVVSYPVANISGYIKPKLGLRYTQYQLEENIAFERSPDRLLPIASLDSGLFFDRNIHLSGKSYLNTLEPRAYYLYVPDENQDDLPIFDTGTYTLSYDSLFRNNRFSNPDRVGDANQLTLAVTSRLIERASSLQQGYVRIAQTFFFSDQNVGVFNDALFSPFVMEMGTTVFKHWDIKGEMHFDPDKNVTQKMVFSARYRQPGGRVLNLSYRVRRPPSGLSIRNTTDIEQTTISFHWPVNNKWNVIGRWNYAVPESKSIDMFAGIEYESCCFGVRAVARRFLTNLDGDHQNGFFLQFQLKGLAGIGKKTVDFLHQTIPGYQSGF